MKKVRQIIAWIGIIVIIGLVIATFVLSIIGNGLSLGMLILTMGVSMVFWVLLWFLRVMEKRNSASEAEGNSNQDTE
ncbi:MAG: hypothetical protein J6B50_04850 [Lachnospiraceae bacterium]|nr:hypothetical protein [Lachnospiraceae bacterium]